MWIGKFQLTFCISCHQLSIAVNSCWQLIKVKINLESWNLAQVTAWGVDEDPIKEKFEWNFHIPPKTDTCAQFQLSTLIFVFISSQQLLTADDSRHIKNFNGIFIYLLKLIPVAIFIYLGWFSFLSAVNWFWQLETSVTKKIWMGF